MLYIDDIFIIENDIGALSSTKVWLAQQFDMKDIGEANCILGIQILRDKKNRRIALIYRQNTSSFCNVEFQERVHTFSKRNYFV